MTPPLTDAKMEEIERSRRARASLNWEESGYLLDEVKRLNELLDRTVETTGVMVEALKAENARLREALAMPVCMICMTHHASPGHVKECPESQP